MTIFHILKSPVTFTKCMLFETRFNDTIIRNKNTFINYLRHTKSYEYLLFAHDLTFFFTLRHTIINIIVFSYYFFFSAIKQTGHSSILQFLHKCTLFFDISNCNMAKLCYSWPVSENFLPKMDNNVEVDCYNDSYFK